MRYSRLLLTTRREAPGEAATVSHALMERTAMIRKLASGIYNYYPMMIRVMRKVETIIREELDRAGAQELLMPSVQPSWLWEKSGRWNKYGPELLRLKDRKFNEFCMGPTHEEVITSIVANEVNSYKQLPLNLYQIQTKFRDEIRPRFGVMRAREFIMKDAYSFDVDEQAAKLSYHAMYDAYCRIFSRCGLHFRPVAADTGNIGGSLSHEFQVLADSGEDFIAFCTKCDYAANVELAQTRRPAVTAEVSEADFLPLEEVFTPEQRSIEEVSAFLGAPASKLVKTLIFFDDQERFWAVGIRGDLDVNELKLQRLLDAAAIYPADEKEIAERTGAPVGFIGPHGVKVPVILDESVRSILNGVTGANKEQYHVRNFNWSRDVPKVHAWADLALVKEGDPCPHCDGGALTIRKGIEVGHVFYLGTKYSVPMEAFFLGEDGQSHPCVMGCYGIGVTRTVAAAIEQNWDENGLRWPMPLAPFQVLITPILYKDRMKEEADRLYQELLDAGVEVLLDDRDERAGVKFKDADLLGIPLRVTVGDRKIAENKLELFRRRDGFKTDISLAGAGEAVRAAIAEEFQWWRTEATA